MEVVKMQIIDFMQAESQARGNTCEAVDVIYHYHYLLIFNCKYNVINYYFATAGSQGLCKSSGLH